MSFLEDEIENLRDELLPYAVMSGYHKIEVDKILELAMKHSLGGDKLGALNILQSALKLGRSFGGFMYPIDREVVDVIVLRPSDLSGIPFSRVQKENWLVIILYKNPNDNRVFTFIWRGIYVPSSRRWFFTPLPFEEYDMILKHINIKSEGNKTGKGDREEG